MFIARSSASHSSTASPALEGSVNWLSDLMTGSIAVTLCVIAVAFVGFAMLTGRMPIRRGLLTAIGAFVLLAAPIVASGLAQIWQSQSSVVYAPDIDADSNMKPRDELDPSSYDPYAGASLNSQ